jgi:hypothetical protein
MREFLSWRRRTFEPKAHKENIRHFWPNQAQKRPQTGHGQCLGVPARTNIAEIQCVRASVRVSGNARGSVQGTRIVVQHSVVARIWGGS